MATRLNVDANRLFSALSFFAIALLVVSLATVAGGGFAPLSIAAIIGVIGGAAVAAYRSRRGLGSSLTSEREPSQAGTINAASIPVIGIGGLGLLVASAGVGFLLPGGRELLMWGAAGGILGAAALLAWRHFHGGSPFMTHPRETLHLR